MEKIESRPNDAPLPTEYMLDDAASAIRQLMQERDQAFEEGQRDMQLSAAEMTNDPAIFAKIYDLPILTRPLKRF